MSKKLEEKNRKNWGLILDKFSEISAHALVRVNDILVEALMTFGTFDIDINVNKIPNFLERNLS